MADSMLHNKHLLWRAGFGPGINQIADLKNMNIKTLIQELFKEGNFTEINYDTPDPQTSDDEMTDSRTPAEKKKEIRLI